MGSKVPAPKRIVSPSRATPTAWPLVAKVSVQSGAEVPTQWIAALVAEGNASVVARTSGARIRILTAPVSASQRGEANGCRSAGRLLDPQDLVERGPANL